jgi:FixJ family two-component response regulator
LNARDSCGSRTDSMPHDQSGRLAMNPTQPLVIVIDDDLAVREALRGLLETIELEAWLFASPQEFLNGGHVDRPACIVMDIRLPGLGGFDVQAELARQGSRLPIIFITGFGDVRMSVRAMKAGAVEFLTKPFSDQEFLEAVQAALRLDRDRREQDARVAALRALHATLTVREQQVMELLAAGLVSKQIAADVGISEVTVRVHRGQIMQKMQARSLADLVRITDLLHRASN